MKNAKIVLPFVLASFLISCQNVAVSSEAGSPSSETSSLIAENSKQETSSSSPLEKKGCVLNATDFPERASQGYPEDQEISSSDGSVFFVSSCMQGGGKGEGCVQMKKESSFFYNRSKLAGTVTFKILQNGAYTGIPTIYEGDGEHPLEKKISLEMTQKEEWNLYTGEIHSYFTFANESSYAIYLKDIKIA
ncbi:MAG TPA: hypothetical protein DDW18_04265 [Firmicutes bacterium]|nr:hypothetical protein [Bacillota bacterium]